MRQAAKEDIIPSLDAAQPDVRIPAGWDVWLYFVGGGRDPAAFGESWDRFEPERFTDYTALEPPFSFGAGPKTCLGQDLTRTMAVMVAQTCLQMDLSFEGIIKATGVRGWLGWERNNNVAPEDWAADMKQLPTQHPTNPIMVRIRNE